MQAKRKNLEELLMTFSLQSATKKDFEQFISILRSKSGTVVNGYFQKVETFIIKNYNNGFGDYIKSVLEKEDLELLQIFDLLYSNSLDLLTFLEKYFFKLGVSKLQSKELKKIL